MVDHRAAPAPAQQAHLFVHNQVGTQRMHYKISGEANQNHLRSQRWRQHVQLVLQWRYRWLVVLIQGAGGMPTLCSQSRDTRGLQSHVIIC